MSSLVILVPIALLLGVVALAAFLWSLRSGQYDDMDGAAVRIFLDGDEDRIDHAGASDAAEVRSRDDRPFAISQSRSPRTRL